MATSNVVFLRGSGVDGEGVASGAITPGALLRYAGQSGTALVVAVHNAAGGAALPIFADVAGFVGRGLADDYADGERVPYRVVWPGGRVNALLAAGATVTVGTLLESTGDGTLRPVTTGTPIAVAVQAVDNSGGTGAARCAVEVL